MARQYHFTCMLGVSISGPKWKLLLLLNQHPVRQNSYLLILDLEVPVLVMVYYHNIMHTYYVNIK